MKTIQDLSEPERAVLEELRLRLKREFPDWTFRMTLFGSRARGDAEPDSDMDVLLEVEKEHVDRHLRRERGDFSIFQTIQEEGIPV